MRTCARCGHCFCVQAAVERFYTSSGYLLPLYHKQYWLGYATDQQGYSWPNFTVSSSEAGLQPVVAMVPLPGFAWLHLVFKFITPRAMLPTQSRCQLVAIA